MTFLLFLSSVVFWLLQSTEGIPPEVVTIAGGAVTLALAIFLHFGPVPSKYVSLVGAAAGTAAVILPKVVSFLPPKLALIVIIVGYTLSLFNGRIQGSGAADNPHP